MRGGAYMVSRSTLEKSFNKIKNDEIELLINFFGNQNQVATVLGVDRTRITRWQRGINPDEINSEKITGLIYVLRLLFNHYYPETALKWLQGNNVFVGHARPIDLIRLNKIPEVIAAVRQDIAGSYA
jgi:hypothetical protein